MMSECVYRIGGLRLLTTVDRLRIIQIKRLLISTIATGLMLSACASNKSAEESQAPQQVSVEEAKRQCQQAGGAGQDSATFDACMKGKDFEHVSVPAQIAPAPTREATPATAPAVPAKK